MMPMPTLMANNTLKDVGVDGVSHYEMEYGWQKEKVREKWKRSIHPSIIIHFVHGLINCTTWIKSSTSVSTSLVLIKPRTKKNNNPPSPSPLLNKSIPAETRDWSHVGD